MATIKKAQGGATKDSTEIFKSRVKNLSNKILKETPNLPSGKSSDPKDSEKMRSLVSEKKKALSDQLRQSKKGKPGYDANGFPLKKKMKNGGSLTGLKASNKRVGPVDPKGAFTKVQKKTLAGAKGKASLTKDKQLGATKMKCGGRMSKRK